MGIARRARRARRTPTATVERELYEELGIKTKAGKILGEVEFRQDGRLYVYTWLAAVALDSTQPRPKEPKHDECGFFYIHRLRRTEDLSPNMKILRKKIVDGEVRLTW